MQLTQHHSGKPLRDHLLAAVAAGAAPDPRLTAQPPAGCLPLWLAFLDLIGARNSGMAGDKPIPPSEMQAWQAGRNVRLRPWELDTLAAMDRATLAVWQAAKATPQPATVESDA